MSALPPKADICSATRNVRFVPIADIALFDQLVGADQYRWWNRKTKRLGGLLVDRKIEIDRLFYRKRWRRCALDEFVDVNCGAPVDDVQVRSIRDESARFCKVSID